MGLPWSKTDSNVSIWRTDREQICSRINNNDCRTFRAHSPLSTAYKTDILMCLVASNLSSNDLEQVIRGHKRRVFVGECDLVAEL